MATAQLKGDIAQLYELTAPDLPVEGYYGAAFGTVNFAALTAAQAEALVAAEFPHLRHRKKTDKNALLIPETPITIKAADKIM